MNVIKQNNGHQFATWKTSKYHKPFKFLKHYLNMRKIITIACSNY